MTERNDRNLAGQDPSKSWVAMLISWSVSNQLIVLMLAAALAVTGWMAIQRTPLDAVPDLTDTRGIIRPDFPGQSPRPLSPIDEPSRSAEDQGRARLLNVRHQFCVCHI